MTLKKWTKEKKKKALKTVVTLWLLDEVKVHDVNERKQNKKKKKPTLTLAVDNGMVAVCVF